MGSAACTPKAGSPYQIFKRERRYDDGFAFADKLREAGGAASVGQPARLI
jgi:hypothetical protein